MLVFDYLYVYGDLFNEVLNECPDDKDFIDFLSEKYNLI